MNYTRFLLALVALEMGRLSILEAQGFQLHPTVGCSLPLGNTIDSQIENHIADTVGCSSVRAAAIDLVDVVPAIATTKSDRASDGEIATPVSTAWDPTVRDPFITEPTGNLYVHPGQPNHW